MDRVAASSADDRALLFRRTETAMARGCHAAIVEKENEEYDMCGVTLMTHPMRLDGG